MFRHILCPTDLKKRAFIALKKAVEIAHQFNSKITMLNARSEFMAQQELQMLRVSSDGLKEKFRRIAVESREEMKAVISKLHAEDIQVDYVLREGKPETIIVFTLRYAPCSMPYALCPMPFLPATRTATRNSQPVTRIPQPANIISPVDSRSPNPSNK
jgi:hypothetical protein